MRTSNGYALIARTELLARNQERALERARLNRRDLNITATRLLYQIYSGALPNQGEQRLGNNERVALASLLKAGLVVRQHRRLEPAPAVLASLENEDRRAKAA